MKKILSIEFGSTRIKALLINEEARELAKGVYEWENEQIDGLWCYSLERVREGLAASYADLVKSYGEPITEVDAIGISGMMHGYVVLDECDRQLAPFRTWRNTNTPVAAAELSELFSFNVPLRWSVAQYYQSVLDGLAHVKEIRYLSTLAGYVHYLLTGERVLGINDASGMFPVTDGDYDAEMMKKFNATLASKGCDVDFKSILPRVLLAGERAGTLTEAGALLIDPTGHLKAGAPLCPPEGDMGTGMIATGSITRRTAQVSSGTSANLTVVLERPLTNYYPEIDVIATPDGSPCAMVHTNNCTSEINEWVGVFSEVLTLFGVEVDRGTLFTRLFEKSLASDESVGGIVAYNFLAGEVLAKCEHGAPLLMRAPSGEMNLANFMAAQIYSAIATLDLGMGILKNEGVGIDSVIAHGGYYKTPFVGQNATSALLGAPVTVMQNASEGGAFGMALLALYMLKREGTLPAFLEKIFSKVDKSVVSASAEECEKCHRFLDAYRKGMDAERLASIAVK